VYTDSVEPELLLGRERMASREAAKCSLNTLGGS
jgi:hypothetical protein